MSSLELSGRLVRSFYDLPCNLDPVTSKGRQSTRHPRQFEHRGTSLRWVRDLNPPSDRPGKTLSDESPCIAVKKATERRESTPAEGNAVANLSGFSKTKRDL